MEPGGWFLPIWIVETHFGENSVFDPGWRIFPRINGVGFSSYQTPVDAAHVIVLEYREIGVDQASLGAGHPFGADHGSVVDFELINSVLQGLWFPVMMEGDHIRVRYLKLVEWFVARGGIPYAHTQGLRWVDFPRPVEGGLK